MKYCMGKADKVWKAIDHYILRGKNEKMDKSEGTLLHLKISSLPFPGWYYII